MMSNSMQGTLGGASDGGPPSRVAGTAHADRGRVGPASTGRRLRRLALVAASVFVAACGTTVVDTPAEPSVPVPAAWIGAVGSEPGTRIEAGWWHVYGDPVLDTLVAQALAHNSDLRTAAARVAEARALTDVQRAAAFPSVNLAVGAQRARAVSEVTGTPYVSSAFQPQFQAAYEVDLWGRLDALNRAADAQLLASVATRDSLALSVAATATSSYINLLALDARLEVARRTLAARESALALARSRQARGYTSSLETLQSESEYRATAQAIPQLELSIARQEHSLRLLAGAAPGPVARGSTLAALTLPSLPEVGVPSQLLRRRPDLAIAEAQLAATDATLSAARAQLLPSVRLSASLGRISSTALPTDPFTLWSLGGSILAPIFEAGRLEAAVRASDARREQALVSYQRTVLVAFSEVEDQLSTFDLLGRQALELEGQRRALEEGVRVAGNRYREGYASFLDSLDAQRMLFSAEQAQVQLRADRLASSVALYRVMGGGWGR